MKIFGIDGKIYKFMNTLWTLVKINFLWLIFSLPIITFGAATAAAFKVTMNIVEEQEGYVFKDFISAFKDNFKQGTILGLGIFLIIASVILSFALFNTLENNPIIFLFVAVFLSLIAVVHLLYIFPLIVKYENTLPKALYASRQIFFKYILRSLVLLLIIALLVIVFIYNFTLMFIGMLIAPVSIFLTINQLAVKLFNQIENENKG